MFHCAVSCFVDMGHERKADTPSVVDPDIRGTMRRNTRNVTAGRRDARNTMR